MVRDYEGRGANYTEGMMVIICKKKEKGQRVYTFFFYLIYIVF